MNDLERDQLQKILQDDQLLAIVKKVFANIIDENMPKVNEVDNDHVLGQKFRAYIEAKYIINRCFAGMESYKDVKNSQKDINKAR